MRAFAIVLIVVGALMMVYTGFNYVTKEKVVDIGRLEINKENTHPVRWSPIVGALLILGGVVMIATGKGKTLA